MQESAIVKRRVRLEKAVDRFYREMQRKDMRPSFNNYMRFRFFKEISAEMGEWLPADHAYYRDMTDYYYEVRIGFGMKMRASLLMPIGKFFMKDMAPRKDGSDQEGLGSGPEK